MNRITINDNWRGPERAAPNTERRWGNHIHHSPSQYSLGGTTRERANNQSGAVVVKSGREAIETNSRGGKENRSRRSDRGKHDH